VGESFIMFSEKSTVYVFGSILASSPYSASRERQYSKSCCDCNCWGILVEYNDHPNDSDVMPLTLISSSHVGQKFPWSSSITHSVMAAFPSDDLTLLIMMVGLSEEVDDRS